MRTPRHRINRGVFMAKKKGIDVSYWNGRLTEREYNRIKKAGVSFVIARAGGYRGKMEDSTFSHNYQMARAANLGFGAYYYSTAVTTAQAKQEARHAVALCKGKTFDYPIWMDVEDAATLGRLSKRALTRVVKAFVKEVRKQGRKAGVYASYSWLTEKIGSLQGIDVWVAQYNDTNSYKGKTAMWQYSDAGRFKKVTGKFDLNWCYKNYETGSDGGESDGNVKKKLAYTGTITLPKRGYFTLGDRGKKVRQLQRFLNWYGNSLEVDGIYGSSTRGAVKRFQQSQHITADGLFGKESLKKAKLVKR